MAAFDATTRIIDIEVEVPEVPEGEQPSDQQLLLVTGALAPVGNNQAIQVPLGVLRIPLDYDSTETLIKKLSATKLKRKADIQLATSIPQGLEIPGQG